ncbi:MAG: hypothetical protein HYS21_02945 [Deltaproteobacteria bacterium]|nr:hypothetical protein [Deltaproteobacteria bacterium]
MVRIFAICATVLLLAGAQAFALEEENRTGEYRFLQGVVSSYSSYSFILNERQVINIVHEARFFDSQGRDSGFTNLSENKWVYVEGAPAHDGSITAEKIYFLPGYVSAKHRHKYGFMNLP